MVKFLCLILFIIRSIFNFDIASYDNKTFFKKFSLNNFYIENLIIRDNKFQEITFYNKNNKSYNSIKIMDINKDKINEIITYSNNNIPEIKIIYNDENILKISLQEDLDIQFSGIGLKQALYYIDIAEDNNKKYYLHSFCSNRITSNAWIRTEKYLSIENNKIITVDKAQYMYYSTDYDTWYDGLIINGIPKDNFKELENKYKIAGNDKFIIPY